MTNEEIIAALRNCACVDGNGSCAKCAYKFAEYSCKWKMMCDAADELEAAEKQIARLEEDLKTREAEREVMQDTIKVCEKRIAELEAQLPKEGEWIDINGTMFAECSVCGKRHYGCNTPYCDMCGARMKGENDADS